MVYLFNDFFLLILPGENSGCFFGVLIQKREIE